MAIIGPITALVGSIKNAGVFYKTLLAYVEMLKFQGRIKPSHRRAVLRLIKFTQEVKRNAVVTKRKGSTEEKRDGDHDMLLRECIVCLLRAQDYQDESLPLVVAPPPAAVVMDFGQPLPNYVFDHHCDRKMRGNLQFFGAVSSVTWNVVGGAEPYARRAQQAYLEQKGVPAALIPDLIRFAAGEIAAPPTYPMTTDQTAEPPAKRVAVDYLVPMSCFVPPFPELSDAMFYVPPSTDPFFAMPSFEMPSFTTLEPSTTEPFFVATPTLEPSTTEPFFVATPTLEPSTTEPFFVATPTLPTLGPYTIDPYWSVFNGGVRRWTHGSFGGTKAPTLRLRTNDDTPLFLKFFKTKKEAQFAVDAFEALRRMGLATPDIVRYEELAVTPTFLEAVADTYKTAEQIAAWSKRYIGQRVPVMVCSAVGYGQAAFRKLNDTFDMCDDDLMVDLVRVLIVRAAIIGSSDLCTNNLRVWQGRVYSIDHNKPRSGNHVEFVANRFSHAMQAAIRNELQRNHQLYRDFIDECRAAFPDRFNPTDVLLELSCCGHTSLN
jgi:hypothetical protein